MAFTRVPDPNLDVGKPTRSVDIKQIRDNQDDHESRLLAVEDASIRVFSHFNRHKRADTTSTINISSPGDDYDDAYFYVRGATITAYSQIGVSDTAFDHYLHFDHSAAGSISTLSAVLAFNFASNTMPITFHTRIRRITVTDELRVGLMRWTDGNTFTEPTDGIFLDLGGSSGWRFRTRNASTYTNGTDFSVTDNTWYDVKILLEDSPSTQARCYFDGVLKETFTTNLPTSDNLYGVCNFKGSSDADVDRMLVSAAGVLDDV